MVYIHVLDTDFGKSIKIATFFHYGEVEQQQQQLFYIVNSKKKH